MTNTKKKLLLLLCVGGSMCASATTYSYWKGPEGGDWWSEQNWTDGIPDHSGMVAKLSTLDYPSAGTYIALTNAAAVRVDKIEVSSGEWTLRLGGTLALEGASNDNTTINVSGNAKLTIDGGILENQSVSATTGTGGGKASVALRNCVSRGLYTLRRGGSDADSPDTYTINGGEHHIRTWYPRLFDNMVVSNGIVRFGSIHGYDRYGENKDTRCRTALEVVGGRVAVDGEDKDVTSASLGIVAKGRGVAEITVGGNQVWLANGGATGNHSVDVAWRVQDKALFRAAGPYVANIGSTGSVEVVGGHFVMTSSFVNCGDVGDGRCSNFLLDGGVLDFDYSSNGSLAGTTIYDAGSYHRLIAGKSGARLRNRNNVNVTIGGDGFVAADDGTGGVTLDGKGKFVFSAASAYAGGMMARGRIQPSVGSGAFGTGVLTLKDGGTLQTELTTTTELPALRHENAAFVKLDVANAHVSVPSVIGSGASVLMLVSNASRESFGITDARYMMSENAPVLDSLGLPEAPIIAVTKESNNSAQEAHLLTYDSMTKKFKNADYTTDLTVDGVDKIAYVTSNTSLDSKSFGAVVVRGASINGSSTIGRGGGNAYLVLLAHSNSSTQGQLTGGGSVNFGAARGYVLSGAGVNGSISCGVNGYLKGSGGVVFCTMDNGGIKLYRQMSYTGGTKILSGTIELTKSGSYEGGFGSGTVEVLGGEYTGGSVRFSYATTDAHDFIISGFGAATGTKTGVLDFRNNVTLSGQVVLTNDAMICATSGSAGTLSNVIGGSGDLYLGGDGVIGISGIDINGDVHVDGSVATTGSIVTGERFLFVDGMLVFNNTDNIVVDAKVLGAGRIVLAGTGKVDFSDLSVFDGLVDVAGNANAEIGALYGIVSVTNSAAGHAAITVAGTSAYGFFGSLAEGVDIAVSGGVLVGNGATIPADASLGLAGGALELYEPTTFASLYGAGTVLGGPIKVSGAVIPVAKGHEDAITFGVLPVLERGVPDGWSMHKTDTGFALSRPRGFMVVVR